MRTILTAIKLAVDTTYFTYTPPIA